MASNKSARTAMRGTAAYAAGAHLHKHGPMNQHALFAVVDMGHKTGHQEDTLQRAIRSGWLVEQDDQKINISRFARAHYDQLEGEKERPVGQIAAVRRPADVFTRPPLSKRFILNPRGTRQDIPEWSLREKTSFKSLGGGDA